MQRHRTDFVALFFGLAFLALGTGFIVHQTTGRAFDASWIAAVSLVSIGCIFLGATLLRGRRSEPLAPEAPAEAAIVTTTGGPVVDDDATEAATHYDGL